MPDISKVEIPLVSSLETLLPSTLGYPYACSPNALESNSAQTRNSRHSIEQQNRPLASTTKYCMCVSDNLLSINFIVLLVFPLKLADESMKMLHSLDNLLRRRVDIDRKVAVQRVLQS